MRDRERQRQKERGGERREGAGIQQAGQCNERERERQTEREKQFERACGYRGIHVLNVVSAHGTSAAQWQIVSKHATDAT